MGLLIPISVALENQEFLYTGPKESILCLDQTRLYNFITDEAELYLNKTTVTGPYVCTQSHAVMSHDLQETRAVKLLQQKGNITKTVRLDQLS